MRRSRITLQKKLYPELTLYYQFQAERTGEFTWDYLEQGQKDWRVRIGKPSESA